MMEQTNVTAQLTQEIHLLRKQNKALAAQLAVQQKVFREIKIALGQAGDLATASLIPAEFIVSNEEVSPARGKQKLFNLTGREQEVLKQIVKGLTSKEIAEHLGISKLTVDTHRKHIQQKMGVSKQVDLLKLAMQSGIA
jgi:DNA-binding CsgD family transcriptional regulator